jgi:hypothetical protein
MSQLLPQMGFPRAGFACFRRQSKIEMLVSPPTLISRHACSLLTYVQYFRPRETPLPTCRASGQSRLLDAPGRFSLTRRDEAQHPWPIHATTAFASINFKQLGKFIKLLTALEMCPHEKSHSTLSEKDGAPSDAGCHLTSRPATLPPTAVVNLVGDHRSYSQAQH